MKRSKRIALMALGLLMIGAGIGIAAHNLYEDSLAASSSADVLSQFNEQRNELIESVKPSATPSLPAGVTVEEEQEEEAFDPNAPLPTITVDGYDYIGTVVIPPLEIELPVADTWDYVRLKISPCLYKGSPYRNDLIICAHNYMTHFRNIKNLQPGDDVIFTDAAGNEFRYKVEKVEILDPYDIEKMETSGYDLTLFTCTLGGKSRVTVRCRRADE